MKYVFFLSFDVGVEDGMTLRLDRMGDAPISGAGVNGDLLVRVNVARSQAFTRQGSNLYYDARIPFHTAILGGKVRVPTLEGDVDVRVPGGTQPGEEMVLKGRGVPPLYGSGRGDLFVRFAVTLPRYWSPLYILSCAQDFQVPYKTATRTLAGICRRR